MTRLDDLQVNGLKMLQDPSGFRFGSDAVELANFVPQASIKSTTLCDLGCGSGILALLLASKKNYRVAAVEIQESMANLCKKNVELNGLGDKVTVYNGCMKEFCVSSNAGAFDVVVSNPPYEKMTKGQKSENESVRISRFEEKITLQEVVQCAAFLVKFGGYFYIVHKTERMAEVIDLCSQNKLTPKILQVLRPGGGKPPHLFLLQCKRNGAAGLSVLKEREVDSVV